MSRCDRFGVAGFDVFAAIDGMPESHVPVRKSSWRGGNHFLLPWFRLGSRFLVAMTLLLILVPLLLRLFQKAKIDDLGGRDRPRHIGTFADQIDKSLDGFRLTKASLVITRMNWFSVSSAICRLDGLNSFTMMSNT